MTRTVQKHHTWDHEVVVITGASAGVGRATARRFARAGASVALLARDPAALDDTKAELESIGGNAMAVPVDVADFSALFAAATEIESRLGPIRAWVNDAMLTVFAPVHEMTPEEFRRVTEVTYLGFVYGTMAALQHMRKRDSGVIVQVGSSLAYRGIPLQSAYCGAKHAIRGFTDSLRTELLHEHSGISVVMVQLPAVNTPQFDWARTHMSHEPRPVPPVIQPEIAAEAIFEAASRPRREVWLDFSTAKIILGNMLVPVLLDRYLARRGFAAQEADRSTSSQRRDNLLAPIHDLHRTRGSFGSEARGSAVSLTGQSARLGVALLGIGAASAALYGARSLFAARKSAVARPFETRSRQPR